MGKMRNKKASNDPTEVRLDSEYSRKKTEKPRKLGSSNGERAWLSQTASVKVVYL